MTYDQIIAVLVQLPIVAIFIWYFDRSTRQYQAAIDKINRENQEFLREERNARAVQFERLERKVQLIDDNIDQHRKDFNVAMAEMRAARAAQAAREIPTKPTPRGGAKP